ncbi:MAG: N-6 DNA methylase [SAR324 cluster bacterium]|nr:N-6 DNA methylase [SAR324 cluster bacterium]
MNAAGDRTDDPATVHQINVLTVVAGESYQNFVAALQKDISESLSSRRRFANEGYFTGKILRTPDGDVEVTKPMAQALEYYLIQNGYVDFDRKINDAYHDAKQDEALADLPEDLKPHAEQVFQLIDSVFSDAQLPEIGDDRKAKINPLNSNFQKKEFQDLWSRINRKAAYTVHFETSELVEKCIAELDKELKVSPLQYVIAVGEQTETATHEPTGPAGDTRKAHGAYFTPPDVAGWLVRQSVRSGENVRVLDPTCGNGVFLTAALEGVDPRQVELFGADISAESLHVTEVALRARSATGHLLQQDFLCLPIGGWIVHIDPKPAIRVEGFGPAPDGQPANSPGKRLVILRIGTALQSIENCRGAMEQARIISVQTIQPLANGGDPLAIELHPGDVLGVHQGIVQLAVHRQHHLPLAQGVGR